MYKLFLAVLVSMFCFISNSLWAFGSEVNVGEYQLSPGQSLKINVDDTKLYTGISYDIKCTSQKLLEDTTIGVYNYSYEKPLYCRDKQVDYYRRICNLKKGDNIQLGFNKVIKGHKLILTITSYDQSQTINLQCHAKPKN